MTTDKEFMAYQKWRESQGMPLSPRKLPKVVHTVSVSELAWEALQQIAVQQGLTHGEGGNVSRLLEAIGQQILMVRSATSED